jgi:hypothetical protein
MPHGPPDALGPIPFVDDVASKALTLNPLCQSLGAGTVRAAGAAEAGEILSRISPAAIITSGADRQTRTCRFPASGSSRARFARGGVAMEDPGLDRRFMIADCIAVVPEMVATASERLSPKAGGALAVSQCLSNLTRAAKPIDPPTLTAFIASSGLAFKSSRRDLH